MNIPVYERIFTVPANDLCKYITESESRYYIIKIDKVNNVYIIGERKSGLISQ